MKTGSSVMAYFFRSIYIFTGVVLKCDREQRKGKEESKEVS
jgi:hypothetical protein